MSWWNNATDEQRLAQVKSGLELGMTQKQIALNLKVSKDVIHGFATRNHLDFYEVANAERARKLFGTYTPEMREIDNKKEIDNTSIHFAFDLFGNSVHKDWTFNYLDTID